MTQNRMRDTRLDLEAPLLSVRRHPAQPAVNPSTKPAAPATQKPFPPSWRPALPFYNSELKSGPVRNPGVVPFVWEQKPGQPKAGPSDGNSDGPSRNFSEESLKEEEEEEDNFSKAIETLSCTESFFMNCSVSGIHDAVEVSETIDHNPQASNLMMERFLPAAQAMATSSPQCPQRKPWKMANRFENGNHQLRQAPLPSQHMPKFVARYPCDEVDSDGDEDEYGSNSECDGHFTSKACGLLPRLGLKCSFCLLNPMSGMKIGYRRPRRPLPPATSRKIQSALHCNIPHSKAEDELRGLTYNQKQSVGIPHQEEGGSRNTSIVQSSDSQTLDGFSPCRSSRETLVQILKRDMKNDNSDGSETFDKNGERFCAMSSSHGSHQESGVLSPTMVKDNPMDAGVLSEIPHSLNNSTDREMVLYQRMEENLVLEGYNGIEHVNSNGDSQFLKGRGQSKNNSSSSHSLLPPPLPNTPSESWLSRTLPSVSSKIPSRQSIFGVHFDRRKEAMHSFSNDPRQESDAKPLESSQILDVKLSKTPRRQIRFADVLMTPLSPRSEM